MIAVNRKENKVRTHFKIIDKINLLNVRIASLGIENDGVDKELNSIDEDIWKKKLR